MPRSIVDYLPDAVTRTIVRLPPRSIEGLWIDWAMLTGMRGCWVILGDDYWVGSVWQDPAHFGKIVDNVKSEQVFGLLIEGYLRLFGVDEPTSR